MSSIVFTKLSKDTIAKTYCLEIDYRIHPVIFKLSSALQKIESYVKLNMYTVYHKLLLYSQTTQFLYYYLLYHNKAKLPKFADDQKYSLKTIYIEI